MISSCHCFSNGKWSSRLVSFTLELDTSPDDRAAVLLVKSTFLEFGDGLSLKDRFKQVRKALTDPIFEREEDLWVYEPGVDRFELDEEEEQSERKESDGEMSKVSEPMSELSSEKSSQSQEPSQEPDAEPEVRHKGRRARTTLMLRNLPNNYTRSMLLYLLDSNGFAKKYDFVYLPMDFDRKANLGYAFVNLVAEDLVQEFWRAFDGFGAWSFPSSKVCEVSWSGPKQGLKAHVDRYKNSPVMHKSVPDEYKPLIFVDGVRKRFPPPTIRIQHPKKAGK